MAYTKLGDHLQTQIIQRICGHPSCIACMVDGTSIMPQLTQQKAIVRIAHTSWVVHLQTKTRHSDNGSFLVPSVE